MTSSLLVLGGSGFVGRAAVEEGGARGWDVATFNRGHRPTLDPRVTALRGDRLEPGTLSPLAERRWDLVLDTWSGAPRATRDSAGLLAGRADHYVYISSGSVYAPPPPIGVKETAATVAASPDAESGDYPELKRGSELAVAAAFGEHALILRPGLILGPYEDVGRLPWWLTRMARGGDVLAPGPADLPLQYIDARDLVRFAFDAAGAGHRGPLNAVSPRGHATMGSLLDACVAVAGAIDTRLRWVSADAVLDAGIAPWTELPIWIPPEHEYAAMHGADVSRAHAAGLRCRPLAQTVADTWAWLRALGGPPPLRPDRPAPGLAPDRERAVLASVDL